MNISEKLRSLRKAKGLAQELFSHLSSRQEYR